MKKIIDYAKFGGRKIPDSFKFIIISAMQYGYVEDYKYDTKYGFSKENISLLREIWNENEPTLSISEEDFNDFIYKLENYGIKYKYLTDKEWQRAGYADPLE